VKLFNVPMRGRQLEICEETKASQQKNTSYPTYQHNESLSPKVLKVCLML